MTVALVCSSGRAGEAMDPSEPQRGSTDRTIHPAALDPDVLAGECEFRATRRSGPGGQNRNKVETAVILTHRPTGTPRRGVGAPDPGRESPRGVVPAPDRAGLAVRRPIGRSRRRGIRPERALAIAVPGQDGSS